MTSQGFDADGRQVWRTQHTSALNGKPLDQLMSPPPEAPREKLTEVPYFNLLPEDALPQGQLAHEESAPHSEIAPPRPVAGFSPEVDSARPTQTALKDRPSPPHPKRRQARPCFVPRALLHARNVFGMPMIMLMLTAFRRRRCLATAAGSLLAASCTRSSVNGEMHQGQATAAPNTPSGESAGEEQPVVEARVSQNERPGAPPGACAGHSQDTLVLAEESGTQMAVIRGEAGEAERRGRVTFEGRLNADETPDWIVATGVGGWAETEWEFLLGCGGGQVVSLGIHYGMELQPAARTEAGWLRFEYTFKIPPDPADLDSHMGLGQGTLVYDDGAYVEMR